MSTLLIKGGRVIDPSQNLDAVHDVLIRDGFIDDIGPKVKMPPRKKPDQVIDATGLIVTPGLIDLHVHLREPGQSHKETIATGTAAAAAGGFTSVCAMPNTAPINDSPAITRWMQDPERQAVINVFPIAAATIGSAGERLTDFALLRAAGAVAVSDDGRPILDDDLMSEALELAAREDMTVIQHAEDTRLSEGNPMNEGATSFRLGLRGQPPASEWQIVERDVRLAHAANARLHVAHISTAKALDYIRMGKQADARVTAEVCPHHFLFTEEDCGGYDTNYKMNPPLRTAADREAMIRGIADGTIDAIATDHAPHAQFEKLVEFDKSAFGITGVEVVLACAITFLHKERGIPLTRIIEMMSANPARIANLEGRGTLAKGSHADITFIDPNAEWTYDVKKTLSKSRNCPYDGMKFTGKAVKTIVSGKIVYES